MFNVQIKTFLLKLFGLVTQRLECTLDKREVGSSNLLKPKSFLESEW